MCQHHFLYFILKNIKSFSYSQLSNYTKNATALSHRDGSCYKITCCDFCSLDIALFVNTSVLTRFQLKQALVFTGNVQFTTKSRNVIL